MSPRFAPFVVAIALACPAVAHAQTAEDKAAAEAAFEEGKQLMIAHAFADACPKFAESLRRASGVGTMLGLADCYEKNGQTASAWAEFREAAASAARKGDRRESLARQNATRLEALLSKVLIRVPPEADVDGLIVKRDGVNVGRAEWGVAVPVDPGVHAVLATAPGWKDWQTTIEAPAAPGVQTVTIPRLEAAPVPEPAPLPPAAAVPAASETATTGDSAHTQRVVAIAVAGAGLIGIGVGTGFGLLAKSKLGDSNANGHCDASDTCDPAGLGLRSSAESAALVSTVAFVVGGAAIAGGAVLWFTAHPGDKRKSGNKGDVRVGLAPYGAGKGMALVGTW